MHDNLQKITKKSKKLRRELRDLRREICQTSFGNAFIPIPPPRKISIELTNRCNLRCTMCCFHSKKVKDIAEKRAIGDMDFDLFRKIVEEASTFYPKPKLKLNWAGEFLLYPHFREALMLLKKMGLSQFCFLSTNGNLLSSEVADELIKSFEGKINISLDGFKESHERIRVGFNYEKVYRNLMYLIEQKKMVSRNLEFQ